MQHRVGMLSVGARVGMQSVWTIHVLACRTPRQIWWPEFRVQNGVGVVGVAVGGGCAAVGLKRRRQRHLWSGGRRVRGERR